MTILSANMDGLDIYFEIQLESGEVVEKVLDITPFKYHIAEALDIDTADKFTIAEVLDIATINALPEELALELAEAATEIVAEAEVA